jgi:hypothetical protein
MPWKYESPSVRLLLMKGFGKIGQMLERDVKTQNTSTVSF